MTGITIRNFWRVVNRKTIMKKLFIILFIILAIDTGIFIAVVNVDKSNEQSYHQELIKKIELERGELVEDADLTNRGREFEKLFKDSGFPMSGKIEYYIFIPTEESSKYAGSTYDNIIVINKDYNDDSVLLHELCHVALHKHGYEDGCHNTPEWEKVYNYIRNLGYTVY